jgi:mannosyl-oligosaccharide alpha-1,2-mannosidase
MGTTLVDSLSTLWLMNMTDDFWEARDWVRDELTFHTVDRPVSVFETIIRSLGGLLSAYDLSGDSVFLQKATDLGTRLLPAFDSESGIPYGQTTLHNGEPQSLNVNWHSDSAALAEVGTMQVEFRYLSHATGNRKFAKKAVKIIDLLEEAAQEHLQVGDHATFHGLFPLFIRNQKTKISFRDSKLSLGAMGDSFYEYLLKVWLQGGKTEPKYRRMYDRAMDGMHELLVQQSKYSQVTFLADMGSDGKLDHKMDHLACFMGGTYIE